MLRFGERTSLPAALFDRILSEWSEGVSLAPHFRDEIASMLDENRPALYSGANKLTTVKARAVLQRKLRLIGTAVFSRFDGVLRYFGLSIRLPMTEIKICDGSKIKITDLVSVDAFCTWLWYRPEKAAPNFFLSEGGVRSNELLIRLWSADRRIHETLDSVRLLRWLETAIELGLGQQTDPDTPAADARFISSSLGPKANRIDAAALASFMIARQFRTAPVKAFASVEVLVEVGLKLKGRDLITRAAYQRDTSDGDFRSWMNKELLILIRRMDMRHFFEDVTRDMGIRDEELGELWKRLGDSDKQKVDLLLAEIAPSWK